MNLMNGCTMWRGWEFNSDIWINCPFYVLTNKNWKFSQMLQFTCFQYYNTHGNLQHWVPIIRIINNSHISDQSRVGTNFLNVKLSNIEMCLITWVIFSKEKVNPSRSATAVSVLDSLIWECTICHGACITATLVVKWSNHGSIFPGFVVAFHSWYRS